MGDEQKSSIEKCPTCGTTIIKYDPPLQFMVDEACGVSKPGNYTADQHIPSCMLEKGHQGKHWDVYDVEVQWPDFDNPGVQWR